MKEKPIKLFYSYAHEDEKFRSELENHLAILKRKGIISDWYDRQIKPGTEWDSEINKKIESAEVILIMISSDFLASDYCYDIEMQKAIRQHDSGKSRLIPIILRACRWELSQFSRLQALPKDAKPITLWENRDEAWLDVVNGIEKVIEDLKKNNTNKILIYNGEKNSTITVKLESDNTAPALEHLHNEEKRIHAYEKEIYEDLKQTKNDSIPLEAQLFNKTKFKDAADWLKENKKMLASRACRHIFPNPSEKKSKKFTKELHRYLELILGCLLTERQNLLDEPIVDGIFSAQDYINALKFIEKRIPLHLSTESISELKNNINYLIIRLP